MYTYMISHILYACSFPHAHTRTHASRKSITLLQEMAYIHAEGYSGGALKHGPFALIEGKVGKATPCIDAGTREESETPAATAAAASVESHFIIIQPIHPSIHPPYRRTASSGRRLSSASSSTTSTPATCARPRRRWVKFWVVRVYFLYK